MTTKVPYFFVLQFNFESTVVLICVFLWRVILQADSDLLVIQFDDMYFPLGRQDGRINKHFNIKLMIRLLA